MMFTIGNVSLQITKNKIFLFAVGFAAFWNKEKKSSFLLKVVGM